MTSGRGNLCYAYYLPEVSHLVRNDRWLSLFTGVGPAGVFA